MRVVSHYANAQPTRAKWRSAVLGPFRRLIVGTAAIPDDLPVFGIHSLEELCAVLSGFRDVLDALTRLKRNDVTAARNLEQIINDRAKLRLRRFSIDRVTLRFVPNWDTDTQSFREMLYSYLALAFELTSIDRLHRCAACPRYFFAASAHPVKYCTGRCQIRAAMRRYRANRKLRSSTTV
jgi:hypothetical protein